MNSSRHRTTYIACAIGALVGAVVLHAFSMVVFRLMVDHEPLQNISELGAWIGHSMRPHFVLMILAYAAFGAACGYCVGLLWEKQRELLQQQLEWERERVANEILTDITLTIAHYIRSANTVIGGYTGRILDHSYPTDLTYKKLAIIKKASCQIEAVVTVLQELDSATKRERVGTTDIQMFDIRDALNRKIAEMNGCNRNESHEEQLSGHLN